MGKVVKMRVLYGFFIILLSNILGCATARHVSKDTKLQELQTRIGELEKQLQEKEEEIYNLEDKLISVKEAKKAKGIALEKPKVHKLRAKNIQTALKNAGFYKGPIDGKIGKGTKRAIKDFQKANDLVADGVVGEKTWSVLERYLSG